MNVPRIDPTADAAPAANGSPQAPIIDWDIDDGPREPGVEIFLDLDPASRALLDDMNWTDDEYNAGRWAEYAGEYIAVYHKQLLGHGPDPINLREQMAREHNAPPGKIAITYIEPPIEC